jgi:hypothetical protein
MDDPHSGDSLFNDHPLAHSMPGAGVVHHITSVVLCTRRRPVDFRYIPLTTEVVWQYSMSRRARFGLVQRSRQPPHLFD